MAAQNAAASDEEDLPFGVVRIPTYKVTFPHAGGIVELEDLPTEDAANLALDVLLLKEAVDKGQDVNAVQLQWGHGQRRLDLLSSDLFRSQALEVTFDQLEFGLQSCFNEVQYDMPPEDIEPHDLATQVRWRASWENPGLYGLLIAAGAGADLENELDSSLDDAVDGGSTVPLELLLRALPAASSSAAIAALPGGVLDSVFFSRIESVLLPASPNLRSRAQAAGWTELHFASRDGDAAAVLRLLAETPAAAEAATLNGYLPAHAAARHGHADIVRLLLEAAPSTADAATSRGRTPLHFAAQEGHTEAAAALLECSSALQRQRVLALDMEGLTAVSFAAHAGHAAALQQLLAAVPDAIGVPTHFDDDDGTLPVHFAAQGGSASCLRVLLAAAPEMAVATGFQKQTPLHYAAHFAHAEAMQLLVAAAPETATACARHTYSASGGRWPIEVAAQTTVGHVAPAVRALLPFGDGERVLRALRSGRRELLPLFADFVLCRPPLSEAEWALVPSPCPGLGRALPAALSHSPNQAGLLVENLPPADSGRLRLFAQCLHRLQATLRIPIPQPLVWHILSLFDA